jgi:hypothetical protein
MYDVYIQTGITPKIYKSTSIDLLKNYTTFFKISKICQQVIHKEDIQRLGHGRVLALQSQGPGSIPTTTNTKKEDIQIINKLLKRFLHHYQESAN